MNPIGTESILEVQGVKLHWAERGEGRPLVLLHGVSDSHRTWRRVAPALAAHRRVLMLDLPGHGLSDRPDASYDLDWNAKLVAAWFDLLGLDDVEVVGHSYGGGVAQQLLLHRTGQVRRLGLVSSGGLGRYVPLGLRLMSLPILEKLAQPFMHLGTRIALATSFGNCFELEERAWLAWANGAPGTGRALARTVRGVIGPFGQHKQFLDRAHEIDRLPPVAMYWGTDDPVLPFAHGLRARQFVQNSQFVQFDGCGHFPHLEQPAKFVEALGSFLNDGDAIRATIAVPLGLPRRRSWLRRAAERVGRFFAELF